MAICGGFIIYVARPKVVLTSIAEAIKSRRCSHVKVFLLNVISVSAGVIPSEIKELKNLEVLNLSHNKLTGKFQCGNSLADFLNELKKPCKT